MRKDYPESSAKVFLWTILAVLLGLALSIMICECAHSYITLY